MAFFSFPDILSDSKWLISWFIVGVFSVWGGVVRYLMEYKVSGNDFSFAEVCIQVVISGFTGFLGGCYGCEKGYSELMILVFAGLGGALGGRLLDFMWSRLSRYVASRIDPQR